MKIIYTLNGYFNYGNRLQAFALVKILEKIGYDTKVYWPKNFKMKIKEFIKYNTPLRFKHIKEFKLRKFTKKYIPTISNDDNADFSIIGSDQVWNPDYFKDAKYLIDGNLSGDNMSYAASVGVDNLTDVQKEKFREVLKNYKAISVREKSAKELLQPLSNKKLEVVLDPTLLLDKSEYEKIEKKPKNINNNEKYILCYILGDYEYRRAIEDFATKQNYRVIMFSDKKGSNYGVEEFLYLVHHAELVCTDSFHASVFSFIFERPFVVFRRSGAANCIYTRLQSLIDMFRLKDREFNGVEITRQNLEIDYSEGRKVLGKEQKRSLEFLKNTLGDEDD